MVKQRQMFIRAIKAITAEEQLVSHSLCQQHTQFFYASIFVDTRV